MQARNLDVAIDASRCDLTVIDSKLEAKELLKLYDATVRIEGGSLKGALLANLHDTSTIELAKGAHVEASLYGDATLVKVHGAEWTSPVLRSAKLVAYAECLAISDVWATTAAAAYRSWATPIERGGHPIPPTTLSTTAYDASWCQLEPYADAVPRTRTIDDLARGYVTAQGHLAAAYKEVRIYYTHEDFKDDAFARAPALHAAYVAAMKEREVARDSLHEAISSDLGEAFDRDVQARSGLNALANRLAHDGVLLVLAVSARLRPEERLATRAAIIALCETIAKDYARIEEQLRKAPDGGGLQGWPSFESRADTFVIVTKKGRRALAAKDAPGDPAAAFEGDLPSLLSHVATAAHRLPP